MTPVPIDTPCTAWYSDTDTGGEMDDEKKWPVWPDDQVKLPDLGSAPLRDDGSVTRWKPKKPKKSGPAFFRPCPKCGLPKSIGFPCGSCEEKKREAQHND